MMMPFDGTGGPQQGQPGPMQPMPMPPGNPNGMPPHQPMGYGHRGSMTMPGQPPPFMPSPASRQGSFSGSLPGGSAHQHQFSGHPPLHSPHQSQGGPPPPPMHQMPPQMQHGMARPHAMQGMQGMPPGMPNHQQMRSSSQGGHARQDQYAMGGTAAASSSSATASSAGRSSSGMGGSWQSEKDTPHRREMIQNIVKLLKKDKSGSAESMAKLPQMAKQLEVSLYRNAPSFEAYMDMSTLKRRLQMIAAEVSRKSRAQSDAGGRDDHRLSDQQRMQQQMQQQQPPQPQQQDAYGRNGMSTAPGTSSPYMGSNSMGSNSMRSAGRMVNMDEINPMANAPGAGMRQQSSSSYQTQQQQQQQPPSMMGGPSLNRDSSAAGHSMASSSTSPNMRDPEWRQKIKHKQQRLLLLHHSAKCPHEDGRCPVTQHCADMKRLWRHMEGCKDNNCRVPHCFSSRAILSHYRKCKDPQCPACGPVRTTVRKQRTVPQPSPANVSRPSGGMPSSAAPSLSQGHGGMMPMQDSLAPAASFPSDTSVGNNSFRSAPGTNMGMPPPVPGGAGVGGSSRQFPSSGAYPSSSSMSANSTSAMQAPYRQSSQASNADMSMSSSRPSNVDTSSVTLPPANRPPGSSRSESEWQKIRHKQQRLLLLRHASRCQHETGKCPVTPHCANMKKLWEHIAHCKNQQCTVQHCLSSRYVLSHYRRCKDANCPACGPVRETIRKSHEREKSRSGSTSIEPQRSFADPYSQAPPPLMRPNESADLYEPERKRTKLEPNVMSAAPLAPPVVQPPMAPAALNSMKQPIKQEERGKKSGNEARAESLLNSFTIKQLEAHLESLDRKLQLPPAKLKAKCLEVLKGLQTHQHGWVFNCPVDPVELGLPDYFEIIKKPMDLGTIQKRLENGNYHAIEDFRGDVDLTFDNAMTYNEEGSVVYDMAKELKVKFQADMKKLIKVLQTEDEQRRQNERACTLFGCEKLLFEPPVYFCNGMNCQNQRIRRNSHFYIGGNNQYFWCTTCYNELDDKIPIELVDMTIMKDQLVKKKNDEVHEESWVQCDSCERWVHQICGLFNTRQNGELHSEYCCPRCRIERLEKGLTKETSKPPGAADLPRTMLSEWLEKHIMKRVELKRRQLAEEKAAAEGISMAEATRQLDGGAGPIYIRQVTSMDRKLEVRELMRKRYAHKNYPDEFPFRCKCIVVFQELDGIDVVLFALYLYEHGEDNPPPNQRVLYVSYLDSVHFMRPRKLRTFVYHEILIAYLDYARRKGFSTVHIWACPPLKGDDYIFYAKPEDQKTPRDNRLRLWYIDMLEECQRRNIVGKVTNMYDLYFANEQLDATAVPYLEGDYFPGEAENIIKMIEDGNGKRGGGGKKKSKSNKSKNKANAGARSTDDDGECGMYEGQERDEVMVKLGETIQPMKESFIVAFLNWSGAKEEDMVVPPEVEKARVEYAAKGEDMAGSKRDAVGNIRDSIELVDKDGQPIKVIDDDAEDMDCEILNNRQAFLNLCRGNHYQFDELRRAKHTSIMVLWHLHNRDAPKFVQQCVACSREILSGMRYHCNTCPDYDLCPDCYKNPNTNRGACTHKLQPIAVEPDANQERNGLTDAERKQRQRNLMLHIQLIEHASRCDSKACSSSNCAKMKNYLQHSRVCRVKAGGGCKICKRIWTLLRIHAQKCKDRNCPIPQCNAIREKMRQLQKQQQAMDDRRRLEMNRHMRFGAGGGAGQ